jgi:hypothetical protein
MVTGPAKMTADDRRKVFGCVLAIQGLEHDHRTCEACYPVLCEGARFPVSYEGAPKFPSPNLEFTPRSHQTAFLPHNSYKANYISFLHFANTCSGTQDSAGHNMGSFTKRTFVIRHLGCVPHRFNDVTKMARVTTVESLLKELRQTRQ